MFADAMPDLPFCIWPDEGDPGDVEYLVAWKPPRDVGARYPNLKVMFSVGAGVDKFDTGEVPPGVQLVRMLDPGITRGMVEYVTMAVMALHRDLPSYLAFQARTDWHPLPWIPTSGRRVGIMGFGHLGQAIAAQLQGLGFKLSGWSRRRHEVAGIESYAGLDELSAFLAQSDILVCVLPLTEETRAILDKSRLYELPRGAGIVNVGRGEQLCEKSLLAALDEGQASAAMLDVLAEEPPSPDHPFWCHPRIILTPHIAGITQTDTACETLLDNIKRHRRGQPLLGEVDLTAGY